MLSHSRKILVYAVEPAPCTLGHCKVLLCDALHFLPAKYEIFIRTAKFLQKFIASENSLCTLFVSDARQQLHGIFMQFGKNIQTACQLRAAVYSNFDTLIHQYQNNW